ncbi:unnamed protein product, partial [marine sediment metagenome]
IGPDNTSNTANVGSSLIFNVTISDDSGVENASVEYWRGTGGHISRSLSMGTGDAKNGTWQTTIIPYGSTISIDYKIHATDVVDNANVTTVSRVTVFDVTSPSIDDHTVGVPTTGDAYQFVVNVTDDVRPIEVRIHYTIGVPPVVNRNVSMVPEAVDSQGNGIFIYNITVPTDITGTIPYVISSKDNAGNARSIQDTVIIQDNDVPLVGADGSDKSASTGDPMMFQIDVTDNVMVSDVHAIYWYGTSGVTNTTMNPGAVDGKGNGIYTLMVNIPANFVGTFNYRFAVKG